jgi:hypothetical protein
LAGCSGGAFSTPKATTAAAAPGSNGTGFGALIADWNASHTSSAGCDPTLPCFNPDPALPPVNGNPGSDYFVVQSTAGRIVSYAMQFAPGTPQPTATAAVLRELPADAVTQSTTTKVTCFQMQVHSARLAEILASDDPGGQVFIEFTSDVSNTPPYSSSSVREAALSVATSATPNPDPLAC